MSEEVFCLAVHNQIHDLLGQILRDERGVFEVALIDKSGHGEAGDRFADATRLVKRVLILGTCRVKKGSSQHSISDVTWSRGLASTSVLLALPLRD